MKFLLAYLIYNDGVQTVIAISAIFGAEELGLDVGTLSMVILVVQFVAFFGALFFGWLAGKIGTKRALVVSLVIWSVVVIYAYGFLFDAAGFFILGVAVGAVLGGSQALSRSLFSQMIPIGREAEYFSLYEISERGTSWLGPFVFAMVNQFTGSLRLAILSVILFFVVGLVLLIVTNTAEAIAEARRGRTAARSTGSVTAAPMTSEPHGSQPQPTRLSVISWALYDLANTTFSINIVSLYFSLWVVNEMGGADADYGYANSFSMALLFFTAPILGAFSDQAGRRKPFLLTTTLLCVTMTALLGAGGLALSLALFIGANYMFQGGLIFYDSLLPAVSTEENRGRVSGLGIGLGYLGSFIGVATGLLFLDRIGYTGIFRRDGAAFPALCPALLSVRARAAGAGRRVAGQGRARRVRADLRPRLSHHQPLAALFRALGGHRRRAGFAGRAAGGAGRRAAKRLVPAGRRAGRAGGSRWCCYQWSGRCCTRRVTAAWRAFWWAASSTPIPSTR